MSKRRHDRDDDDDDDDDEEEGETDPRRAAALDQKEEHVGDQMHGQEDGSKPVPSKVTEPEAKPRSAEMDEQVKKRSRRMFGVIVGTLDKIKSAQRTDGEIKRHEIDTKLQERLDREKEELQQQRELAKEQHLRTEMEESQRRKEEMHQTWRQQKINQARFLKTVATPSLYYLPAKPLPSQQEQIDEAVKAAEAQLVVEDTPTDALEK